MKVAAIVPTFERSYHDIVAAFQAQEHDDKALVLVDNGFDEEWVAFGDGVYHVTLPINIGASRARNIGIEVACGIGADAICFWDDDDVPFPHYMSRMAQAIEESGKPVAACQVRWQGKILPTKHKGTQGRMVRMDAIGHRRWLPQWPGQDKRWWARFDDLEYACVEEVLIEAGLAITGGFRSPRAVTT